MRRLAVRLAVNSALAFVCLLLVIPIIVYSYPTLLGADSSYTVMSGSMSPALNPGDLIIVKKVDLEEIDIGDMVTVKPKEFIYTHRVVEKINGKLRLKGDANEDPDPNLVEPSQIIGKVILVFPFSHLYTPYGFISALVLPASLIIGRQMHTIYEFTKWRNRKETLRWRKKSRRTPTVDTTTILLALILTVSATRIITPHIISGSSSYFSDTETIFGFISAGYWIIPAEVDIKPDTLNLESSGEWTTVYAYIDSEYDPNQIDINTVMLEDTIPAEWGEAQDDGRLMVKFNRESVINLLIERGYKDGDEVELTVTGKFLDGVRFEGSDTIKVKSNAG